MNAVNEMGISALHKATERGSIVIPVYLILCWRRTMQEDVMQVLIERGANVNVVDPDGRTPLHDASFIGNRKAVQVRQLPCPLLETTS